MKRTIEVMRENDLKAGNTKGSGFEVKCHA